MARPVTHITQQLWNLEYRTLLDKPRQQGDADTVRSELSQVLSAEGADGRSATIGAAPVNGYAERFQALERAQQDAETRRNYLSAHGVAGVRRYQTAGGKIIYRLPVETFPGHVNNVYLIRDRALSTLVDAGSGVQHTREHIERGLEIVEVVFGDAVLLKRLDHIVITHSHIDHFGGVNLVRESGSPEVWVHDLDAGNLVNYEERLVVVSQRVNLFLLRSGVSDDERPELMQMYGASKSMFHSTRVDHRLRDDDRIINDYRVLHVPGHCSGQICLLIDDYLLTADHILPDITPFLPPESITAATGLGHYLDSVRRTAALENVTRALPGHGDEIDDLAGRCRFIIDFHKKRLGRVLDLCAAAKNVREIALGLFGERHGYNRILALEEGGSHVEYLVERGHLGVANLDEIEQDAFAVPRFVTRDPEASPSRLLV